MCSRGFAGIDSQSVRALGQKAKVSNFASACNTWPGASRNKSAHPKAQRANCVVSRFGDRRKSRLKLATAQDLVYASNCFGAFIWINFTPKERNTPFLLHYLIQAHIFDYLLKPTNGFLDNRQFFY
jgi:hypothetical protein